MIVHELKVRKLSLEENIRKGIHFDKKLGMDF